MIRNLLKSFDSDLSDALDVLATKAAELRWDIAFASDASGMIDGGSIAAAFETFVRDKEQSLGIARVTRLIIPPPLELTHADRMVAWSSEVAARIERERESVDRRQLILIAMLSAATAAAGTVITGIGIIVTALVK